MGESRTGRPPLSSAATRWSELHHGIDPRRVPLLLPWLRILWAAAWPLRRVPPLVLTVLGVVLAVDAVMLARSAPWAAALSVASATVCDGLDGALAVVADRATRAGAVADAVADRVADVAFAIVVQRCGAPWSLVVTCAALAVGVDALRRVRRIPTRITVGERPTWMICAVAACMARAITSAHWPAVACAAVWLGAGLVATVQVGGPQHSRRALTGSGDPST